MTPGHTFSFNLATLLRERYPELHILSQEEVEAHVSAIRLVTSTYVDSNILARLGLTEYSSHLLREVCLTLIPDEAFITFRYVAQYFDELSSSNSYTTSMMLCFPMVFVELYPTQNDFNLRCTGWKQDSTRCLYSVFPFLLLANSIVLLNLLKQRCSEEHIDLLICEAFKNCLNFEMYSNALRHCILNHLDWLSGQPFRHDLAPELDLIRDA